MYPTLQLGSTGVHVRRLHDILRLRGLAAPAGEVFDQTTHASVVAFQKARSLVPDGEVGRRTWTALLDGVREVANLKGWAVALVALGEAARGVKEVGVNTGADVAAYQAVTGMSGAWCASFVTWCYSKVGLQLRDATGFAKVAYLKEWAQKAGLWRPRAAGYCAPTGAVAVFNFSHTGIVLFGGDADDTTIEGNTSSGATGSQRDGDGVYQRSRGHGLVSGYVVVPEIRALVLRN